MTRALIFCLTALVTGCATRAPAPVPAAPAPNLPALPVGQYATEPPPANPPLPTDGPLAGRPPGENITLNAVNVDVRALLPAIAEAAGLSLIMGPELEGRRISVNLVDVPALAALELVLEEADLMVAPQPLRSPFDPVVFYLFPVDIREIGADLIQLRYGVSREMAEWIVESRIE